jgi:hypothetical protein
MDQQTDTDLDQADEEILTYTVSDETLEAAAGTERGVLGTQTPLLRRCGACRPAESLLRTAAAAASASDG